MSVLHLKKTPRFVVKEIRLPSTENKILGSGIDVMTLPDGHLSCTKCQSPFFEAWVYLDAHRLEMGCIQCGESQRLLFPMDIDLQRFGKSGRWTCAKHPNKGVAVIHSGDVISIGCGQCWREVQIKLRSKSNLVIADA